MSSRLDAFRAMVARNPANATAHFGLANEAQKEGLLEEALTHYQAYLAASDDEGAAYGRVAEILVALGRAGEAREYFERGIAAARRFGHPGMASEFEMQLEELQQSS